jgi:hypothetical protein
MQGALALANGVLYVGRHEKTAHVRPYDLDGRPLSAGFSFRGPGGEPCALAGLAVDEDRHVWVGDRLAERIRGFTLFGREFAAFAGIPEGSGDPRGALGGVTDLALVRPAGEEEAEPLLLVARGGWRRHAVQLFTLDGHWSGSLRPCGEPLGHFQDVRAVAAHGRLIFVAEGRPGRIQVFRDGDFHFLFEVPMRPGGRFEPVGLAPLEDGRLVIACAGSDSALLVVDAAGRLVQTLAEGGGEAGQVREPNDVVAETAPAGSEPRVAAIDLDAERVQVFTLAGRCYGELTELPGRAL